MAIAKQFERQLDRVLWRKIAWIWDDVGLAGPGRRPDERGRHLRRDVSDLMELVERLAFRHVGRREIDDGVLVRRRWSLRRRNLRGWAAKRDSFTEWYRARVDSRTCVYVAWAGRKCFYVGRSEISYHRPRSHFEKAWFGRVTHIDVYVPAQRRRGIVKLECLLTHAYGPTQARQMPAHRRHRSRCPVCAIWWRVRQGLRKSLHV
jgi:hypothetical protein